MERPSDLRALHAYTETFKPARITESFRTTYKKYPSVRIASSGPVRGLHPASAEMALRMHFEFEGTTCSVQDTLEKLNYTGLIILHRDSVVHESYQRGNAADTRAAIFSVTKSITSILIGKALADGDIEDLDDPVTRYAPELVGSAYDGVSIQNVLDMSSGIRWNEDYADRNSEMLRSIVASLTGSLDAFAAKLVRENDPGTFNRYASFDTQVLSMVLRGATGRPYAEYLQTELWQKIGAEHDAYLLTDRAGEPMAYGGLSVTTRDLARVGLLMLEGQTRDGRWVVSRSWLRQSTSPDAPHLMPGRDNPLSDYGLGYKNQWWIPLEPDNGDFSAIGIYGQFLYINPARNVVIAMTSACPGYLDDEEMEYRVLTMFQRIAQAVSDQE